MPHVVREPRARLELQPQVLGPRARRGDARRASRSDGDDEEFVYEFHPPRREPHLVRGLVVLPTPQPASPDVFRAAAEPQPRASAMRVGKRRLALFSAFFSAFVVVRLKAQVRVAGGDGAKRDVPSPHIHHHVVRGVRERARERIGERIRARHERERGGERGVLGGAAAAAVPARRRRAARRAVRVRRDLETQRRAVRGTEDHDVAVAHVAQGRAGHERARGRRQTAPARPADDVPHRGRVRGASCSTRRANWSAIVVTPSVNSRQLSVRKHRSPENLSPTRPSIWV